MQTIEKALHQPMPFTTGGQTITDRLTAAKHSLAGSQLGKTICKATTEELMAPKKKHLDYLLHCTNEPNVSIPSMANLLIERTQNPNWTVVYKALITIHNIMCYGNERFSQYLASCNTTFNLGSFLDKASTQGYASSELTYSASNQWASLEFVDANSGYDMSQHVRRYGKYISEKIYTYRLCAYDFCKVKRGREDGLLRTMSTDKLLKTLPILQNQIDALLEFQVTSSELNNGVINCSFILLFRDLIRLFACYNDGVINLLEKYFDMNKKQCREALDMYKAFLLRLDKVAEFLKVAETVGIDRGEIPDLTRAPASLLEALEAHLIHMEGGKMPPPTNHSEQLAAAMVQSSSLFSSEPPQTSVVEDSAKMKYLEEEKERLRMFEEQRKQHAMGGGGGEMPGALNPFASASSGMEHHHQQQQSLGNHPVGKKPIDDLLSLFDPVPGAGSTHNPNLTQNQMQQAQIALDSTNPFASSTMFQQPSPSVSAAYTIPGASSGYPQASNSTAFGTDFSRAFAGGMPTGTTTPSTTANHAVYGGGVDPSTNPFMMATGVGGAVMTGGAGAGMTGGAGAVMTGGGNTVEVQWGTTTTQSEQQLPEQPPPPQWAPLADCQQPQDWASGQHQQQHNWAPNQQQQDWASNQQQQDWASSQQQQDWASSQQQQPNWAHSQSAVTAGDSSSSGDEAVIPGPPQPPTNFVSETVNSALRNPFGAMQHNAQALHTAGVSATVATPMQPEIPSFCAPTSNNSSANPSPVPFNAQSSTAAQAVPQQGQRLGIYDQTPFSHMDGSYTSSPVFPQHMQMQGVGAQQQGLPPMPGGGTIDPYNQQQQSSVPGSQQGKFGGGDLDSALSSLADNLSIGGKAAAASQGKPVQWNNQQGAMRPPVMPPQGAQQPQMPFAAQIQTQQWPPMGAAAYQTQPGMYGQQMMGGGAGIYGQQQPPAYAQIPYGGGGGAANGQPLIANQTTNSSHQQTTSQTQHPFV